MTFQSGDYLDPVTYLRKLEINMLIEDVRTTSGTGSSVVSEGQPGFFNPLVLKTGTTTTGSAGLRYGLPGSLGNGDVWIHQGINILDLSTVSEEYIFQVGLHDGTATLPIANGVFYRYDRLVSINWLSVTETSNVETVTDTGIAVTEDDPVTLHFAVNADKTSVTFYKDNAPLATHTTNIPAKTNLRLNFLVNKSAGTTVREVSCNFYQFMIKRTV